MDGFRGDYVDRTTLPFFGRLMKEGVYSRRFHPVFPPITFPSHCAEATGVGVDRHGITGNDFYDTTTRAEQRFPAEAAFLEAEPIWLTAERQGVRTLVFDWPLSQKQTGPVQDEYFADKFDNAPTDAQRLDHLLAVWQQDDESGRANQSGGSFAPADGVRRSDRHRRASVRPRRAGRSPTSCASSTRRWVRSRTRRRLTGKRTPARRTGCTCS